MNTLMTVSLRDYTTMRMGGDARQLVEITDPHEVPALYAEAAEKQLPIFVLGGGSNVIARDEGFDGIIALNRIKGFEVIAKTDDTVQLKIGAGEVWDEVVARTVDMGLSGIEAMSAIPGTAGAAPVQNVGAYGQEIADTLISLEAYDSHVGRMVTITAAECEFSYRHSIFRGRDFGRYCITSITIELSRHAPRPPFYAALQRSLDEHNVTTYTPAVVRRAVIAIRQDKLPDPKKRPNSGSFFKNALISAAQLDELLAAHPDAPHYAMPDGHYKVPTGWLIDRSGLRGQELYGMKIHDKNALVLINQGSATYHDLAQARQHIIDTVAQKFHIQIEQEPLEL